VLHVLTLDRLEAALARRGCPICAEVDRTSRRYLRGLLREHKASDGVWERLRDRWGLCAAHTREMLGDEARTIRGLSAATLYQWLASDLLRRAGPGTSGWHGLGRRRFRALLVLRGSDCLACEQIGEYERAVATSLIEGLGPAGPPALHVAFERSDGLCLPHLRIALDLGPSPEVFDALAERFLASLDALVLELEQFLSTEATGRERRSPEGAEVWLRAAERFAGRLWAEKSCGREESQEIIEPS
jgi:hypothetical protein